MRRIAITTLGAAVLSGCATAPYVSPLPTAEVVARGETAPVGTQNDDAADDPAIWRNPADPTASLIVGTDKKAGLYVYSMDGVVLDFAPDGRLNNVDLVDIGDAGIVVAASDRGDPLKAQIRLYRLSREGKLSPIGTVPVAAGEAYGLCLYAEDDALLAYSVLKDGTIVESAIDLEPLGAFTSRTFKMATQGEGCVVDPRNGTLYAGEEMAGIWRFARGATEGEMVAATDGEQLVADVEGLALLPQGDNGGWLVASSQGDSAYAVYSLPDMRYVGRFRVRAGDFGATDETDGIALQSGDFGPVFPDGLFVAQDGINESGAQNFKLVRWDEIVSALGLK
ncbi:phytase [Croceicoccus sediminis]|uniref:phytase n=1 Tax=Croceicoccus sediminis TaxID=2571150 RepID=UPI0011843D32|nr:phytase [Croceicoccus sediminis]